MSSINRNTLLSRVLRALGNLAVISLAFPVLLLVYASIDEVHLGQTPLWLPLVLSGAVGVFQVLWSQATVRLTLDGRRQKLKRILLRLSGYLLGALLSLATVASLPLLSPTDTRWPMLLIQFALSLFSWIVVGRANRGSYYDSFQDSHLTAYFVILLLVYIVAGFRDVAIPDNAVVGALLYVLSAWALLRNQANIDAQMSRGHHSYDELPARIRRNNILMVLGIAGALGLLFLFRRPIILALQGVLQLFLALIRVIFGFIFREGDDAPAPLEPQPEAGPGPNDMQGLPAAEGSPWWNLLYVVMAVAFVAALIYYRHGILAAIRERLQKIAAFFRKLLNLRQPVDSDLSGSRLYDDTLTDLDRPSSQRRRRSLFRRSPERRLKRRAGKLADQLRKQGLDRAGQAKWSRETIRETYRILLTWLQLSGYQQEPSYTPRRILETGRPELAGTDFTLITEVYERARYALQTETDAPLHLEEEQARQLLGFLEALHKPSG